ncbi:MAG: SPFH domain-containing protein, partial [Desulforhopalus sp.]|nr:SPFH domain-containing protein [Desulforhopalus sp.]
MAGQTIGRFLGRALHHLVWVYSKWLLIVALIAYALSGIYKIERDSVGVLTRFGKVVDASIPPGLHYKLPWPVDRVQPVVIREVKTLIINDFGSRFRLKEGGAAYSFYNYTDLEPYCLTGDNNIVAITLVIKYTIDDAVKYLYAMKNPEYYIERSVAELIVHRLAALQIDEVLTRGKKQLEFDLQNALIADLEEFNA